MRRAVILANGTPPSRALLSSAVRGADLFVCADGGAEEAALAGLTPEAIIGDLDSTSPETLERFRVAGVRIVRDADQERTDTEKAIEHVLAKGSFDEIAIYAGSTGRIDHVLGNLSLFHKYAGRANLVLADDHARAWLAGGNVTLDYPEGTVVSFFAVGGPAEGVTTENLRYPLTDRTLRMGSQDSISNVVAVRPGRIRIGTGRLVVVAVNRP
jgi:thiamine pyrophosphokinase